MLNYCLNISPSKWGSQRWTCKNRWIWRTYSSCPRKRSFILLLHKFLQFATNWDIMAFGTAKLAATTFGRLRGGTPRVYSWRSSECSNGRMWRWCSQYMIRGWHVMSRTTGLLRNEFLDCNIKRRTLVGFKFSSKPIMKCINLRWSQYLTKSSMSLEHTSGGSASESCSHIVEVWG